MDNRAYKFTFIKQNSYKLLSKKEKKLKKKQFFQNSSYLLIHYLNSD